jgi:hypothetical protein
MLGIESRKFRKISPEQIQKLINKHLAALKAASVSALQTAFAVVVAAVIMNIPWRRIAWRGSCRDPYFRIIGNSYLD